MLCLATCLMPWTCAWINHFPTTVQTLEINLSYEIPAERLNTYTCPVEECKPGSFISSCWQKSALECCHGQRQANPQSRQTEHTLESLPAFKPLNPTRVSSPVSPPGLDQDSSISEQQRPFIKGQTGSRVASLLSSEALSKFSYTPVLVLYYGTFKLFENGCHNDSVTVKNLKIFYMIAKKKS